VQLLRNGDFYAGRRFDTRAQALGDADHVRVTLSATVDATHPHSTDDDVAADARHGADGPIVLE
jgi:hypothetical protein